MGVVRGGERGGGGDFEGDEGVGFGVEGAVDGGEETVLVVGCVGVGADAGAVGGEVEGGGFGGGVV